MSTGNTRRRRVGLRSTWIGIGAAMLLTLSSVPAQADEYEASSAGHPLRVVAYALHPVGVVYDFLLLRPAFWVGSHEPFRSLFGRTD